MIFYFLADRKILVFFQISKNHSSVNFCRRQKIYLKYRYEISYFIEKNKKRWIQIREEGGGLWILFDDFTSFRRYLFTIRANNSRES